MGIQTLRPGPTAPSPPEPAPYQTPHMSNLRLSDPPKVWRPHEVELEEIHSWLIPRLKDKWPRLSEEGVLFMLKAAIADNHILFLRTPDVVGLFDIMPGHVLESKPIVNERFVRQRGRHSQMKHDTGANEQGIALYRHVRDYGKSIRAREFNWGGDTDQPYTIVASALQDSRIGSENQKTQTFRVVYTYE